MTGRPLLAAALAAAFGLGGCGHVHVPYLPGDRPFETGAADDRGADRRVDPVQTRHPVAVGSRPPCKFGGKRCPPWERAWPANPGAAPADKVTETGQVVPAKAGAH